jgi:multidrug resistance protein
MPAGFWPIWTTVAIDLVGFGIVSPILGRYAERFHAGGLTVGLMFASFSVAQMLCAPILGRISDRVGRKPVIIFSLVGTAVGSVITGAAGAIWVLFLGRIIDGSSGASVSVAQGAIADIAPPEQRARLMGMLGAAFGVGFVLGPAIGGLAALGGPRVPFFIAGGVAAVNAIVAFVRLPETKKEVHDPHAAHHARSPRSAVLVRFAVVGFISTLGFSGFEATFSLFGQRRFNLTEGSAAMVFLVIGLALTAVQGGLIGPLTSSLGSGKLLRIGLLVTGAGLAVLAFTPHMVWVMLFASMLLLAFGQGVASPSITALVTETAPPDRRGEALGYQQSAGAFARIAGPIVAGALFDHVGVGAPYVIGAVLAVLAVGVLATSPRQTPVRA